MNVGSIDTCLNAGHDAPVHERQWVTEAIARLLAESDACAETPLRRLVLPGFPGIRILLKDESVHASGSLKHRLARSLFLYALCSGKIRQGQTMIDASSGSTAISEAWFAQRLGLPFIAVMPRSTSRAKQHEIIALGGRCALVDTDEDTAAHARELAGELDACYLDQFGEAGSATDWRGNNNIAQSILQQCIDVGAGDPDWIVCGAGTGGTSTTIGRYLRYSGSAARLCVADPVGAAFARGWREKDRAVVASRPTFIEGVGRPRVEACFNFDLVDEVLEIGDSASIAGAWWLERRMGRRYGGSSGTNIVAALQLATRMRSAGRRGSVVTLLCDRGERYADTLFDPRWLATHHLSPWAWIERLERLATAP